MILENILQDLPVKQLVVSDPHSLQREVLGITQDSRLVRAGFIFVAIEGEAQDGHRYISQAIQQGAVAVVGSKDFQESLGVKVLVENARFSLAQLACRFYGNPSSAMRLIAVTGTNGKTTTSYLIESILKAAGRSVGVMGTVNYRYAGNSFVANNTTPESIDIQKMLADMKDAGVTDVVMEVSSHALTMNRVYGIDFDIAAFTNLTQDHLDYHQSLEKYFEAKRNLFTDFLPKGVKKKFAVLNIESPWASKINPPPLVEIVSVGLKGATISCEESILDEEGIRAKIKSKNHSFEVQVPLLGRFNLENILVSIGVAQALGMSAENIQRGLKDMPQVPGRLERIDNNRNLHVFVDFAHTPDALARVGEELRSLATQRLITVFGCGGDRDKTKRPLMAAEAEKFSDMVIITSDNPRTENPESILNDVMKGFSKKENVFKISDRREALSQAVSIAKGGDMILVAGKGHEDYQIIGKTKIHFSDQEVLRDLLKEAA
ncbi:MAG: UDP-N-acetylmuramoyl-L-alanyl-D-glutamate--2,6-diaminopimelate ligase [Deltaproteobacteria bacterium]|nr:MAG: UDP-N-acetylmuramoyl-L-alanyl-D-glutamate--2,6-diaminopimelate ligase [Deltaproteobacteria bacterium]